MYVSYCIPVAKLPSCLKLFWHFQQQPSNTQYLTIRFRHKLKAFYDFNSSVLLPKEIVLKDRMDANSRHELLLYSAHRQFAGAVARVSCCELDKFHNLPKPDQLIKERDVALKREVVVLKGATNVYFRHTFRYAMSGLGRLEMPLNDCTEVP